MAAKKTHAKKNAKPKITAVQAKKASKAKSASPQKTAPRSKASSRKPTGKTSSALRKKPVKKASAKKVAEPQKKTEPKNQSADNKRKMMISVIAILLIFIIAFAASNNFDMDSLFSSSSPEPIINPLSTVDIGDTVSVNYIGSFTDGKVFDTSYESIAKENDLYAEGRGYAPLTFKVGAGQMIKGFDAAVVSMELGETKTVTISPEDAYGASDPEMIIEIPTALDRIIYLDREFNIPSFDFENVFGEEPVLDSIVGAMFPWNFTVKEIGSENITLEYMMEIGDTFVMPQTAWNSTVTAKNDTKITIMQNPEEGQIIQTLFGPASITLTEDTISLLVDAEADQEIMTPYGQGTVVSVNDDLITFDLNSPMAGKTLIFEITVENVTKAVVE